MNKRSGINGKRRVAVQQGTAIDSSSESSSAYGDGEDNEERNHVEEEETTHSHTSPGVHTPPGGAPGRSVEDSDEMWDRERKEKDLSSSSSLLRTSPVAEPSGEQVIVSERQGERTASGIDPHQPKSYSARVYVHRNETSPRWNDKRENSAACKGDPSGGEQVEKERRDRKDDESAGSETSSTTTESLGSSIRRHSM